MMIIIMILSDVNFKVNSRRGRGGSARGGGCAAVSQCAAVEVEVLGARCSLLTLAHSVKGLNEGFDGRSGLCVGVCVGDGGDAAPVTAAVRVRRPHRVSRGPGGHSGQGHRLYNSAGQRHITCSPGRTLRAPRCSGRMLRAKVTRIGSKKLSISMKPPRMLLMLSWACRALSGLFVTACNHVIKRKVIKLKRKAVW